jgi:putative glutamine amidotransferase
MSTPLIGVTTQREKGRRRSSASWSARESYCDAVAECGGAPVLIPCSLNKEALRELSKRLDGIVLTGGGDVHPRFYSQKPGETLEAIDEVRDEAEITLARIAMGARMPLLGICRGMQVINVALGGTLHQDISSSVPEALMHDHQNEPATYLAHSVSLEPASLLTDIIALSTIEVNSRHHQAIRRLAPGLRCSARSPDDLIEAVERIDTPFILGVQWHPEGLLDRPESRALFRVWIDACRVRGD